MTTKEAERFNTLVGGLLRAAAAFNRKSIAQVAKETPIDRSTLIRYLDGVRPIPMPVLYRVCEVIGTTPQEIITDATARMATGQRD
ncbi:helix-turn-helix transcriptional regulator [Microbacterium sp. MPKO10]|uniref:helix-turn-helix domain-containing protein n=1 Tax=Microbacterium sp. MPKO10 TaxID=2989818 RepID=UPI0022359079|nr:helix-turn-helix domain-containing protein [Microbacterium sp. MPKO10]MCW4458153.1 helix-turn-helix domain-containing protein [Microbacterium sp. MPKO10]